PAAASGERDAFVKAKQPRARRRLVVDDNLDVRHLLAQFRRQRAQSLARVLLEAELFLEIGVAHRPNLVRRRMPSRRCTARSPSPSLRAAQTNTANTIASGIANTITMTAISAASVTTSE